MLSSIAVWAIEIEAYVGYSEYRARGGYESTNMRLWRCDDVR